MAKSLETEANRILQLARQAGMLRVQDVTALRLHPENLRRLCKRGLLTRISRGLYAPVEAVPTEQRTLAEACKIVPQGVVCLLSALQFHGLTTQLPFEIWLAVDRTVDRRPRRRDWPPLHLVRFSGAAFRTDIQEWQVEGVLAKVYSPAKTVADCFKYRGKIGQDVALEALRECWRERKATMNELWRAARVCRVANVMRPYLEFLS